MRARRRDEVEGEERNARARDAYRPDALDHRRAVAQSKIISEMAALVAQRSRARAAEAPEDIARCARAPSIEALNEKKIALGHVTQMKIVAISPQIADILDPIWAAEFRSAP